MRLLADCGESPATLTPVAIETSGGLFVAALVASGRAVYAINPLATSRYRDRHRSSRAKSDAADAIVLANVLRTDIAQHRPLPDNSDELLALRVLTRAQQDAVWDRIRLTNRIRALLKQYFPAAIGAFDRGGRHRLDSAAARPSCGQHRHRRRHVCVDAHTVSRCCCDGPADPVASPPRPPACSSSCAPRRSTSHRRSRRRWACQLAALARPARCHLPQRRRSHRPGRGTVRRSRVSTDHRQLSRRRCVDRIPAAGRDRRRPASLP